MKKILSAIILSALVMSLGLAAAGCKGADTTVENTGSYADAIPGGSADVSAEVLEALTNSGEISVYSFGDISKTPDVAAWRQEFINYYEAVYGGTIDYIDVEWENWESKFITAFAANDNPDLIYLFEKNFPKFTNRAMVYSVEEMIEKGVVGFDHPKLTGNLDLVYENFKYKGKHYVFATNDAEADMMFINEDLFDKYEVKSPTEYYNEGVWNWETFEKCAAELTRDTDGDGASDVWGYWGWDGNFAINAAGGELVQLDDNGTLKVTIDSAATAQGLENYSNVFGRLKAGADIGFRGGNLGMIAWMPSNEVKQLIGTETVEKYNFNWGMVPYPLDVRTNSANIRSGKCSGWTVATTCDNIQGCINYMIAKNTFEEMKPNPAKIDYKDVFTPEQLDMINDCTRQAVLPIYQGVGNLWHSQWDFWTATRRGGAATEIINTYKPLFEAQVALENNYSIN